MSLDNGWPLVWSFQRTFLNVEICWNAILISKYWKHFIKKLVTKLLYIFCHLISQALLFSGCVSWLYFQLYSRNNIKLFVQGLFIYLFIWLLILFQKWNRIIEEWANYLLVIWIMNGHKSNTGYNILNLFHLI